MGSSWSQPKISEILLDDEYALMTNESFNKLAEYSFSMPTGVYVGKMWKCDVNWHRKNGDEPSYFLCWFGFSEKGEKFCSNNYRKILIA